MSSASAFTMPLGSLLFLLADPTCTDKSGKLAVTDHTSMEPNLFAYLLVYQKTLFPYAENVTIFRTGHVGSRRAQSIYHINESMQVGARVSTHSGLEPCKAVPKLRQPQSPPLPSFLLNFVCYQVGLKAVLNEGNFTLYMYAFHPSPQSF